jgi:hypothetical protein
MDVDIGPDMGFAATDSGVFQPLSRKFQPGAGNRIVLAPK